MHTSSLNILLAGCSKRSLAIHELTEVIGREKKQQMAGAAGLEAISRSHHQMHFRVSSCIISASAFPKISLVHSKCTKMKFFSQEMSGDFSRASRRSPLRLLRL